MVRIHWIAPMALIALAGCAAGDRYHVSQFRPYGADRFSFQAHASISYPPDSPGAEAIRMEWLEQYLKDNGMCAGGYEITERTHSKAKTLVGLPAGTLYYEGRCKA